MTKWLYLPKALTIFNRSTINLENETEVIKSFRLVKKVVENLDSNILFYSVGKIKDVQKHRSRLDNGNGL